MAKTSKALDLSGSGLSSEDTALIAGWLHHAADTIEEVHIASNPDFVGEKEPGPEMKGEELQTRVQHWEEFLTGLQKSHSKVTKNQKKLYFGAILLKNHIL